MPTGHTGYRGDIQIYRAVAVIAVLLYHMGVPGLSSGFLGVDIFFVISGYLMATLYGPDSTPVSFYVRRARRLMPAYFATIAATLLAAFFITVPADFAQLVSQTLFASTLSSNIGFWMQNSYFSKSEFNPLLHLWSLGVECQFYLIFPLLIIWSRRWRWALPLMFAGSLLLCFAALLVSPKLSFFMLPMRVWEFAIGMWVAAIPRRSGRNWYGMVGLAVMLVVLLLPIDGQKPSIISGHPGLVALIVACATGASLLWGLPIALVDSAGGRLAQRLGNVSYSLYLAHWPVLVLYQYAPFGGTRSGVVSLPQAAIAVAMIGSATFLLYRLFERPGPKLFTPRRSVVAALGLAVTSPMLLAAQSQRFDAGDNRIFAAWTDRATYRCGKVFRVIHAGETLCQIGTGSGDAVLLIGDSHSDAIKQAFAASASQRGLRTYFAVDNNPLITPGLDGEWLRREATKRGARAVFLHYATKNLSMKLIDEARTAMAGSGIPLFLVMPMPEYRENVPQRLYDARHGGKPFVTQDIWSYRRENAAVISGVAHTPDIGVIDAAPSLCAPVCRVADDAGRLLYFDDSHLTLTGAEQIRPALDRAMAMVTERR